MGDIATCKAQQDITRRESAGFPYPVAVMTNLRDHPFW